MTESKVVKVGSQAKVMFILWLVAVVIYALLMLVILVFLPLTDYQDIFVPPLLAITFLVVMFGVVFFLLAIIFYFRGGSSSTKANKKSTIKKGVGLSAVTYALILLVALFIIGLTLVPIYTRSNNSTQPDNATKCVREEPYEMEPEFTRALSLIGQRLKYTPLLNKYSLVNYFEEYKNCVYIEYSQFLENTGPEGVFYFDEGISNPNKLVIGVNDKYKVRDDLLLAVLLSHELAHVVQFVTDANLEYTCYDLESAAFYAQMEFILSLNPEEAESLDGRINSVSTGHYTSNAEELINQITEVALLFSATANSCPDNDIDCLRYDYFDELSKLVRGSVYYQRQCSE